MPKKVLFVGAIDGKVELEFVSRMGPGQWHVYITSYLAGPELRKLVEEYEGDLPLLAIRENVDGTKLSTVYSAGEFDVIAWLGPTNDDDKGATAALVQRFVQSAAEVLKPGGVVYVLQDLRTPNFRNIVKIPGAYFLCEISLENRTQTQSASSSTKKVMEGRKDHLFAFQFDKSAQPVDVNNEDNAHFEEVLTMIMSSRSDSLKKQGETASGCGALSKKEIADLIFEYANH